MLERKRNVFSLDMYTADVIRIVGWSGLSVHQFADDTQYVWLGQIWQRRALAEWFTLATCSWTHNVQVVRSGVQVSSWHSAEVSTRCHSACWWSNVALSTAVCIVIRSCDTSNTSFKAWGQSLWGWWKKRMEQFTWVRHWLLVTSHLQETYLFCLLFIARTT